MSNFILAYGNQVDAATLSAGQWNATYPLTNLQDYRVGKKARTTDANALNTKVRFALAAPAFIGLVALMATNASQDAAQRVLLYSDATFTTTVYDSGVTDVYPDGVLPFGTIPWGAANWWTAKPLPEELARFQRNVPHVLSNAMYAQYGEIQVIDPGNTAGYFEAGRLMVGSVFQPTVNPEYGSPSLVLTTRTERSDARDGTPYFNARKPLFSIPFGLTFLSKNEAMRVADIQAVSDIYGEAFVMWDPSDVEFSFRRQAFGRLKALDPITHPRLALYATAFQVEGIVA